MAADKTPMTPEHKVALEKGRANSRAVSDYLEALESTRPKRGRRRTPDSITTRLGKLETELTEASGVKKVQLLQERRNLNTELVSLGETVDISGLEAGFVRAAKSYSDSKGIAYATWREAGIPTGVLTRAGLTRGS